MIFSLQGKPLQYASDFLRLKSECEFVALLTYCNLVLVNKSLLFAKRIETTKRNQDLPTTVCKLLEYVKDWKEISQLSLAETIPT